VEGALKDVTGALLHIELDALASRIGDDNDVGLAAVNGSGFQELHRAVFRQGAQEENGGQTGQALLQAFQLGRREIGEALRTFHPAGRAVGGHHKRPERRNETARKA
jgi:hypothetical protein